MVYSRRRKIGSRAASSLVRTASCLFCSRILPCGSTRCQPHGQLVASHNGAVYAVGTAGRRAAACGGSSWHSLSLAAPAPAGPGESNQVAREAMPIKLEATTGSFVSRVKELSSRGFTFSRWSLSKLSEVLVQSEPRTNKEKRQDSSRDYKISLMQETRRRVSRKQVEKRC